MQEAIDLPAKQEGPLRRFFQDYNLLHVVLLIYTIPIVILFILILLGLVALAYSEPSFGLLLLVTVIIGLVLGLPEALR